MRIIPEKRKYFWWYEYPTERTDALIKSIIDAGGLPTNFPIRAFSRMCYFGIVEREQICATPDAKFLGIAGFGRKSLNAVRVLFPYTRG